MARNKGTLPNIDNSNPGAYPNGRIKDNTGAGDGTPVDEFVYGDMHEFFAKLMRLYGIAYSGNPDNETNGYQYVDAARALASKNDYVLALTSADSDTLSVPLKLNFLQTGEAVVCLASVDLTTETEITGSLDTTPSSFVVTFKGGDFKTGEYVRLVRTAGGIDIVRLSDGEAFNLIAAEFGYLKAASQAQEDAGAIDTVATTPLTHFTTFAKRVNQDGISDSFLANATRNGLLSKEQWQAIENLTDPADLIEVTTGTVLLNSQVNGANQNNSNFNFFDVTPPAGKTMADLKGFMATLAFWHFSGNVDSNDRVWCKYTVRANDVRIFANSSENQGTTEASYFAIWI